jgi:hypothetical protein
VKSPSAFETGQGFSPQIQGDHRLSRYFLESIGGSHESWESFGTARSLRVLLPLQLLFWNTETDFRTNVVRALKRPERSRSGAHLPTEALTP